MAPSATSSFFLNTSRDGDSATSLGGPFQCLIILSVKNFLISILDLLWCRLRLCPLILWLVVIEKRLTPRLATPSFHGVVESDEVSPEPPFLQAKQPNSLSHSLQDLCSRPFTSFVALLWTRLGISTSFLNWGGPELDTTLKVWPNQCWVQGKNHCLCPAGHSIPDPGQVPLVFLGTLLAHVQSAVSQHPQVPFCLAIIQPLCPQPVVLQGVLTKVWDPALGLAKLH